MNSEKVVEVLICRLRKWKIFESKLSGNSKEARKLGWRPQKYFRERPVIAELLWPLTLPLWFIWSYWDFSRFKNDFLWCWCTRISWTRGYGSGPFQGCDVHCQAQDGDDRLGLKWPFKSFQSLEEMFKCLRRGGQMMQQDYGAQVSNLRGTNVDLTW